MKPEPRPEDLRPDRLREPWPSENVEIRSRLRVIVGTLLLVDDKLVELRENLVLPRNVEAMWNSKAPMSFAANVYAVSEAVRNDCVEQAITALIHAIRQDEESLSRTFGREQAATLPDELRWAEKHALAEGPKLRIQPDDSVLCEEEVRS